MTPPASELSSLFDTSGDLFIEEGERKILAFPGVELLKELVSVLSPRGLRVLRTD